MLLKQNLSGECRSEVRILGPDQLECISADACVQASVRLAASGLVGSARCRLRLRTSLAADTSALTDGQYGT
jgi:hypothetical protein